MRMRGFALMTPPALLIIDVQKAIDDPGWGNDRNNPQAETNIAALLAGWRARGWPVIHVRHLSLDPASSYRPGQPGAEFKPEVVPIECETIIDKHVNSAFVGTRLEGLLRDKGIESLVLTGVITNNSVEATARMAGNLGFETFVVSDATATFGRCDFDGKWRSAGDVHAMSLANLDGEYATIIDTADALTRFDSA